VVSDSGDIDRDDPVGPDPDFQAALVGLEKAMKAAAQRKGRTLETICLGWITADDQNEFGAATVKGNIAPEAIEFVCDVIADDSGAFDLPEPKRALN
jgi:hypothetical protein